MDTNKYKRGMKLRMIIHAVYVVIGAAMAVISFTGISNNEMLSSFGIALAAGGAVNIIRTARILGDEEKLRRVCINQSDERNIMIALRARSLTFSVYISLVAIAIIVLYIVNTELTIIAAQAAAYSVCLLVIIYLAAYYIIRKKG